MRTPKATHLALLPLAALGAVLLPGAGRADPPTPSAEQVAAQVQAFHDQSGTFTAHFYQTYYHRVYGRYQRSKGTLAFEKPGRMRFDYRRPNGKVIVSDGRTLTVYEPGDEGGPGQVLRGKANGAVLPGAFAFLTGQGRITDEYRVRLLKSRTFRKGHVLELRPKRPDPRYRRVLLYVDGQPGLEGVVHRIRIDDPQGNRNKFELTGLRFNRKLAPRTFAFAPPSGTRSVRL